jgi:catechol 2,3-dioxygenase
MTHAPVITEVGHVAIRLPDLEAAEEFAVQVMGLAVTKRSDDSLWLTHGTTDHCLQYIRGDSAAIDHIGFVARDDEALSVIRQRITEAGLRIVSDAPLGPGVETGFAFEAPGGFILEVYTGMARVKHSVSTVGVRPTRLGHVNFFVRDRAAMENLFLGLLDFRVSDRIDGGTFTRCNVDHHGVGIFEGPNDVLHHYAFEVPTAIELGRFADLIDARGGSVLWGPLRHGMGRNIATYVPEPSGLVVEYYSDMEQIFNDAEHVPGEWSRDGHKWYSLWGPQPLSDDFGDLGLSAHRP